MTYHPKELIVENLWIIPKYFIMPDMIEKRKPLAPAARRAGWEGCNIRLDKIPQQGQIPLVLNRSWTSKILVMEQIRQADHLYTNNLEARGWLLDVLKCVNSIPKQLFSLEDVYRFEDRLSILHPNNHNVRAKIRQQLQLLRDKGFIDFIHMGVYQKKNADGQ